MVKNKLIFALGICLVFLMIFLVGIYFSKPLSEETLDIKFQIGDSIGMALNNSSLDFGKVYPGASVSKKIRLQNNYNFDVRVNFFVNNELKEHIHANPEIILNPGQIVEYPLYLQTSEDMENGNYSGKLKIEFREFIQ
jgi:hypothetical protein